jgi:hypothetical protein
MQSHNEWLMPQQQLHLLLLLLLLVPLLSIV